VHGPEPHESPQAHFVSQHDPEQAEAVVVVVADVLVMPAHDEPQQEPQDVVQQQSTQAHDSPQQQVAVDLLAVPAERAVSPASAMDASNAFIWVILSDWVGLSLRAMGSPRPRTIRRMCVMDN
jgi:hypothetical protein